MTLYDYIFALTHGSGLTYLLVLAAYLLWTPRSIFTDHKLNRQVRILTGMSILAWGVSFINGMVVYWFDNDSSAANQNMSMLIDLTLCIPSTTLMLYSFLQAHNISVMLLVMQVFCGSGFTLWYTISGNEMIVTYALLFWAVIVTYTSISFYLKTKAYARMIRDHYSSLHNKEIKWMRRLFIFLFLYALCYIVGTIFDNRFLTFFSYLVSCGTWTFIAYHADTQMVTEEDLWNTEDMSFEMEDMLNMPDAAIMGHMPEATMPTDMGSRLQSYCVNGQLYLDPDLNIARLAQTVSSNRTCLWKYFSEQGTTFFDYINDLRLQYALRQMECTPSTPLPQICQQSGFTSERAFHHYFQYRKGCTLNQYKATTMH